MSTVPSYTFMMSINDIIGVTRTPSNMQVGELCNNKATKLSIVGFGRSELRLSYV